MNCRRVVSLMSAYVDGELAGREMLAIRRHISECPDCAEEYESIRFTKESLARMRTVTPREGLASDIIASITEADVPAHERVLNGLRRLLHEKLSPVAAALAASGVALVILTAGGAEYTPPETSEMVAVAPAAPHMTSGSVKDYSLGAVSLPESQPLVVTAEEPGFGTAIHLTNLTTQ